MAVTLHTLSQQIVVDVHCCLLISGCEVDGAHDRDTAAASARLRVAAPRPLQGADAPSGARPCDAFDWAARHVYICGSRETLEAVPPIVVGAPDHNAPGSCREHPEIEYYFANEQRAAPPARALLARYAAARKPHATFVMAPTLAHRGILDATAPAHRVAVVCGTSACHAIMATTFVATAARLCHVLDLTSCLALTSAVYSTNFAASASALRSLLLPRTLARVGEKFCADAPNLTTVDFSRCASLVELPDGTLSGSPKLEAVRLPPNLTHAGSSFLAGSGLTTIDLSVAAPALTAIGDQFASNAKPLKAVVLPASLTSLGPRCCIGASALEELDLSRCTSLVAVPDRLGYAASSLQRVYLPPSIVRVGRRVLEGSGLRSLDLTGYELLTTIGPKFLAFATRLQSVTFPASLTSLGPECCAQATALRELDLSRCTRLVEVPAYLGYLCRRLNRVALPPSLTAIGDHAFAGTAIATLDLSHCTGLLVIGPGVASGAANLQAVSLPREQEALKTDSAAFARTPFHAREVAPNATPATAGPPSPFWPPPACFSR